jgi:adenylosuccinate lyase
MPPTQFFNIGETTAMSDRPTAAPQNPLHERYASRQMAYLFSAEHRFRTWRRLWVTLARCQREIGLEISEAQITDIERAADTIDLERVAELEAQTRHDVVAHLRHYAELCPEGGGILHLGATSAFVTDNTDVLLAREALQILRSRLATTIHHLASFARRTKAIPCLAYTHFQPAQLTTVGKRACLWLHDFLSDLEELEYRLETLRPRGVKGTTGTQASYMTLFQGDGEKVRQLDQLFAESLGFPASFPLTGQTYSRKQDSRTLSTLAGIAETCHKMGTDIRLLQGVGELSEPFDKSQVGSSAMAYKRNPIRTERLCGLSRRILTDSLSGPLNTATQWLERSLDDSSNRRLVIPDSFLTADAILSLAGHIAEGLVVKEAATAARVARELPFMATETLLMEATMRGGSRQDLHERLREYSLEAQAVVETGGANPLIDRILADPEFRLERAEVEGWLDPQAFTGRSEQQVEELLAEQVKPALVGLKNAEVEAPRI